MEVVDRLKTFEELMAFSPSYPFCTFSYYCDNLGDHIPAVLTGYATSTFPPYDGTREGVFCVEVSDDVKETALRLFKDPVFLTHDLDPHYRWRYYPEEIDATVVREQFKRAYDHLDKYMRAELVITSRVHAALPAAAFGTPALYTGVGEDFDDRYGMGRGVPIARHYINRYFEKISTRIHGSVLEFGQPTYAAGLDCRYETMTIDENETFATLHMDICDEAVIRVRRHHYDFII